MLSTNKKSKFIRHNSELNTTEERKINRPYSPKKWATTRMKRMIWEEVGLRQKTRKVRTVKRLICNETQ